MPVSEQVTWVSELLASLTLVTRQIWHGTFFVCDDNCVVLLYHQKLVNAIVKLSSPVLAKKYQVHSQINIIPKGKLAFDAHLIKLEKLDFTNAKITP